MKFAFDSATQDEGVVCVVRGLFATGRWDGRCGPPSSTDEAYGPNREAELLLRSAIILQLEVSDWQHCRIVGDDVKAQLSRRSEL